MECFRINVEVFLSVKVKLLIVTCVCVCFRGSLQLSNLVVFIKLIVYAENGEILQKHIATVKKIGS